MKILQLAPRMPYPLTDGGAIGIYNITKALAELGHHVTLVTYPLDTPEQTAEAIRDLSRFATVRLVSKPLPPRWKVLLRTIFGGAYPIERRMMPEMFELLKNVVEREQFDIVHVDHAHMGKYGLWLKKQFKLPIILREHNFESIIYERFAATEKNPLKRFVASVHGKRLRIQETQFLKEFDGVAAISEEDLKLMVEVAPDSLYRVIPAGVATEYFKPTDVSVQEDSILWVGSFDWDPNFDAMRHFLESIFPLILERRPNTILTVVGSGERRVLPLAARFGNSVQILGRVPDVRDYLALAAVLVVPLRIGGGMRVKLLEFFAAGKAVVSSSIGAEGNEGNDGEHLLICDTDASFAEAVLELLEDRSARQSLGSAAHELAISRYGSERIAKAFTALYEEVLVREGCYPTDRV